MGGVSMIPTFVTADPRSAGLARPVGDTALYVTGGEILPLFKYGTADVDWCTVPAAGSATPVTADPRTGAGLARPVGTVVLYVAAQVGTLLRKYATGSTNWALVPIAAASSSGGNTASNLGAGSGLYASKVGVDLQFKSLVAGDNVTLTAGASEVTIAAPLSLGAAFLGTGSDGALNYDGSATILGDAPAAGTNPYVGSTVYTLTRDIFATGITIASGVVVKPNGWRIWCTGTITGPGKIGASGGNGANGTNGSSAADVSGTGGAAGPAGGAVALLGQSSAGGAGGNGGGGAAAGAGGAISAGPFGFTTGAAAAGAAPGNGANGGVGQGGGGGGGNGVGSAGGAITLIANTNGPFLSTLPVSVMGWSISGTRLQGGTGGAGGRGGYSVMVSGTGGGGGGGGGGGAPVIVMARAFTGGVTIESNGGNGGNGGNAGTGSSAPGSAQAWGGAGAGGGSGGWVVAGYAEGTAPTVSVTGGTAGTAGGSYGGPAAPGNGGTGGTGLSYIFNLGG